MVADELDVASVYAKPCAQPGNGDAPADAYRVPGSLRGALRGQRVALVDDVMDAGSAVRATRWRLGGRGAEPVAIPVVI